MTNEIGRVLTAMVTPFDDDGAVDYDAVGELARALIASGNDGLVVTGTTGEAPSPSALRSARTCRWSAARQRTRRTSRCRWCVPASTPAWTR